MPDRVEVQNVTCPASTAPGSPLETAIAHVVACIVVRVTIRIPTGHAGLTGIALGYGHNAVLPRGAGAYISGDDEVIVYDLTNYDPGPQWQAFTINTDTQSHSWQLRFEVDEIQTGQRTFATPLPLDAADINAAGTALIGV